MARSALRPSKNGEITVMPRINSNFAYSHLIWTRAAAALIAAVALALIMAHPARADGTVTFFDGTETLSATASGSVSTPLCDSTLEECTVTITAPSGSVSVEYRAPDGTPISTLFIAEPGASSPRVSDTISAVTPIFSSADILLTFDSEIDHSCGELAPDELCNVVENGGIQDGGAIIWRDINSAVLGTVAINFQSDVDSTPPVPEPASILLLGTGLAALARKLRR
jgi:hypothetical protein